MRHPKLQVMVVEPSAIVRSVMAEWIAVHGHEVVYACGNAQQAIAAFDKVDVDLLVLNPDLAGNSGVELLQEKQSYQDLRGIPTILIVQSQAVYGEHRRALEQLGVSQVIDRHLLSAATIGRALEQHVNELARRL